ncbi:MAG: hypothetical protein KDB61_12350, partial [Planctomycetes bacterium]|nr:hypothetical protein [Planctomycetota bacterium]
SHGDRMDLRTHVRDCEECREEFEGSMGTLAAMGHERRIHREIKEKAIRRFELKRCREEAQAPPKALSRGRLRTLLYPAFFAVLMLAIAGRLPFGGGPRVMAQGPGVFVRGHELAEDAGEARIKVGETLHTAPDGHALIRVGKTIWRLRGLSAARLEGVKVPTVRLAEGHLEFHGAGKCLTQFGMVLGEQDSLVELRADTEGLDVEVIQGQARFLTADGEVLLEAGSPWHVDPTGKWSRGAAQDAP